MILYVFDTCCQKGMILLNPFKTSEARKKITVTDILHFVPINKHLEK